ncbi:MAG: CCA tRNA nucleotidyltransferase [Syntrophobacteraceae bacterium]|nr:CCA tRNA nucleotidyltransferase [Syntrophobacteraceae bacterium]
MLITSAKPGLSFVPEDVLKAMEKIRRAGFSVWLVGGAVRDFLRGIQPRDWDLATSAKSVEIISLFPSVIPVGLRHGTVQVHTRIRDIEVTSIAVSKEAGIVEDLARRDFTINSMALSYPEGALLDPNAGRRDLAAGLIRGVGEPAARFLEDPLRIVRAARLCGMYGFQIDPATLEAMIELAPNLAEVSGERIRDEILKILTSPDLFRAFELLRQSGALQILLPSLHPVLPLNGSGVSILDHTLACILSCPPRIRLRLAALFHKAALSCEDPAAGGDSRSPSAAVAVETMKSWNMSNRLTGEVAMLVSRQFDEQTFSWSDASLRRFITGVGRELVEDFLDLAKARALSGVWSPVDIDRLRARVKAQLGAISAFSVRDLALGGNDVIKILSIGPGPQVGKVLQNLFDLVQQDPGLNTRESLTRIVEQNYRAPER